jgi:predicted nucleotidyltransferase
MGARDMLLGSETLYRVILYFIFHAGDAPHFRALQRHVGSGVRPLRAALERLETQGLIRSQGEANRRVFRADEAHAGWEALRHMVRAFADPADVLREGLSDVPGIEAAFVFGSAASGETRPESDVDVLIVGEDVPRRALGRGTSESSAVLGREVNVVRCTRGDLARRVAEGNAFLRNVLSGPRRWVLGDELTLAGAPA